MKLVYIDVIVVQGILHFVIYHLSVCFNNKQFNLRLALCHLFWKSETKQPWCNIHRYSSVQGDFEVIHCIRLKIVCNLKTVDHKIAVFAITRMGQSEAIPPSEEKVLAQCPW